MSRIVVTATFADGSMRSADATAYAEVRDVAWLDGLADDSDDLFELWYDLAPGSPAPATLSVSDSVAEWFDAVVGLCLSAATEDRPAAIAEFAASPDADVRESLAHNPHAPRTVVDRLCADSDPDVAAVACRHPRASDAGLGAAVRHAATLPAGAAHALLEAVASARQIGEDVARAGLELARPSTSAGALFGARISAATAA